MEAPIQQYCNRITRIGRKELEMSLTSLSIHNFRGLQNFESDRFSRITLIGGKNNSGKSSVLEAAYYLSGMSNPAITIQLNGMRTMGMTHISSLYPLFYAKDTSKSISICGKFSDKVQRSLIVETYAPAKVYVTGEALGFNSNVRGKRWLRQSFKRMPSGGGDEVGISLIEEDENGRMLVRTPKAYKEHWKAVFDSVRTPAHPILWLDSLTHMGKIESVVKWLAILEKRVSDIRHLEGDEVIVKFDGIEKPLPLQVMGDGMIKALTIAAEALYVGEKGLVCIDEIENGLHYSTMERVWAFIVERAREGTQFLITTHNMEIMKRLAATQDLSEKGLFSYLNIYRETGDIVRAYPHSWEEFVGSLEAGMEIR